MKKITRDPHPPESEWRKLEPLLYSGAKKHPDIRQVAIDAKCSRKDVLGVLQRMATMPHASSLRGTGLFLGMMHGTWMRKLGHDKFTTCILGLIDRGWLVCHNTDDAFDEDAVIDLHDPLFIKPPGMERPSLEGLDFEPSMMVKAQRAMDREGESDKNPSDGSWDQGRPVVEVSTEGGDADERLDNPTLS